jgi:hypothetical protein
MSHYLEHMLFMGSERFPDENDYDSYLQRHGGSANAFTEMVQRALRCPPSCTCHDIAAMLLAHVLTALHSLLFKQQPEPLACVCPRACQLPCHAHSCLRLCASPGA